MSVKFDQNKCFKLKRAFAKVNYDRKRTGHRSLILHIFVKFAKKSIIKSAPISCLLSHSCGSVGKAIKLYFLNFSIG